MKKKIEQLISGKFDFSQPPLLFSQDKIQITLDAGGTMQGELYLGTEDNEHIQGYVTSSNRRFVPGTSQFSGTTIRLPYGADGNGMKPGEVCKGWLCITSDTGEYKIPFEITARKEQIQSFGNRVQSMEDFKEVARTDLREAYRLFTDKSFAEILEEADNSQKALYAGLSRQPVTYQHLEEFLIGLNQKEPVSVSLKTTENEVYSLQESVQESFDIHRSGWGHLRLDVEATGEFLEPERKVYTEEDFIGSSLRINYVIHTDRLKKGTQLGEILVKTPYEVLVYQVRASRGPKIPLDIKKEEKRHKLELARTYMAYRENQITFTEWANQSRQILDTLKASSCDYPEYQLYDAYILELEGRTREAVEILKDYQNKEFSREELEFAGFYLYLCHLTGLYRDRSQALWKIQNFYMQKSDSFWLFWLLLKLDNTYKNSPSQALFVMEELYEKGCTSPLLYQEAWEWVCKDASLLHRMSPFWMQVFHYAGRRKMLTEEIVMRMAYLAGYEKKFYGCLYHALVEGYEQFPSDDILEAICKYIMKGEPRKPEYFRWFSLAVDQGLRLTRLYEYYVETMDISYQRELPRTLLMYFAYNDNTLGDARKAFVYASVIANKTKSPGTYENYREAMERFALRKADSDAMDENYATVYQEFLFAPETKEEAQKVSTRLFTYRLYCDDPKIHQVIIRHSQLNQEEIYPCVQGIAYPRIYTEDAVILFQDDRQRRYVSTVHYNLKKLNDEEQVLERFLELGAEDPGLLLHYCEKTEMDSHNLTYFQKLAECSGCTGEYRDSVRKNILDYYAEHMQGENLDHYLEQMDYRKYVKVDRTTLLKVLISRRMFRQAMGIVEEYGYEGLDLGCLLKLTSRMILKSNMAEDDELIALASEVYRHGKYDEVILKYLMLHRFGPVDEMLSIWKSAVGFEMDTYDLEERILGLLMFTSDFRKEGETVLESYVKQSGKERIIGAYLNQVAYGIFVKEYPMSRFIRERLECGFVNHWPLNLVCRLALLMDLSKEKHQKPELIQIEKKILDECARNHLIFGFFRRIQPELLSPYQLDDKTFVECHGEQGDKITLFYRLDTGLGSSTDYKSEPARDIYQGICVRTFTLFYGETLHYYFQIEHEGKIRTTPERTVTMKKIEGAQGSKYQLLNQMISARKLDKGQEVSRDLGRYLRQEQYVKEMFTIEKEPS